MGFGKFREAAAKCARHAEQHDKNLRRKQYLDKLATEEKTMNSARRAVLAAMDLEIPESMTVTLDYLNSIEKRLYFNDIYADYYIQLADEYNFPKLYNTGLNVKNCHQHWYGDWYGLQRVFHRKSLSLCHNKLCSNCMHLLQASRLKKFTPILEEVRKAHDLYLLTVTVPNCAAAELKDVLDRFFAAVQQIFRYFRGNGTIRNVNFAQYGYYAAIRCLEIVVNPNDFHPHFHILLVLKKDLPLYKITVNTFSFQRGKAEVVKFSELEILLQKILYLAFNKQKVTLSAIENVPLGYSCKLDKIEGDEWHEAFKYVTKLSKDGSMEALSYEQFKTLYFALKKFRSFQCLGKFSKLGNNDSIDTEVAKEYAKVLARLRLVETPVELHRVLNELVEDVKKGHICIISKYVIQKWLNEQSLEKTHE